MWCPVINVQCKNILYGTPQARSLYRWMTFDPVDSPILPGRDMVCTDASEYNP